MGIRDRWNRFWRGTSDVPVKIASIADHFDAIKSVRPQDCLPVAWNNIPQWTSFDAFSADHKGFKASTWVYACAMKTANAVAMIPWIVQRRNSDGVWERDDNTPLQRLLNKPNIAFTWRDCIEFYVLHLILTGNSIVTKVRGVNSEPVEIWPWNPAWISPIPSTTEFISSYEFTRVDGATKRILAGDIIHMMFPDPDNLRWGQSPLQAAMKAIDTDREAATWQKVSLQNMAIPPGVFIFEKTVSKEQIKKAKELYKDQQRVKLSSVRKLDQPKVELPHAFAGPANARDHLFIGGGPKYQQLSLTPQELDYVESRKMSAVEVCAVLDVPPPFVGLLDRATYSNIDTLERTWWEHRNVPLAEGIVDTFNMQLVPEFTDEDDIRFALDTTRIQPLLSRFKERVDIGTGLFAMGYSRNEVNKRMDLGMDSAPDGDIRYVPSSLVPVGADDDGEDS